jgi:hypothetical protein
MFKKIAAMAGLIALSAGAQAMTITFEDLSGLSTCSASTCNNASALTSADYAGFTWTTSSSLRVYSEERAIGDSFYDAATATVMTASTGLGTYMTATGGTSTSTETSGYFVAVLENNASSLTFTNSTFASASAGFTLDSLFLYDDKSSNTTVTITGTTLAGTTVVVTQAIAKGTGGTYSLVGTLLEGVALSSVTIYSTQGKLAIDNITVTALAVPEPSSYAMLLAGLGMMGFIARRRTRA